MAERTAQRTADPADMLLAARRAARWLLSCQARSGAFLEPPGGPFHPGEALFRFQHGSDVWHTVNAILALGSLGETSRAGVRFIAGTVLPGGGLTYWSARPGLCIETTAAAIPLLPRIRASFRDVIRRHALPHGRWATFLFDVIQGFDLYMTGPSVTAMALTALGPRDELVEAGRRYLLETCYADGIWPASDAGYLTPFYPAHVALPWIPDARSVQRYTLETAAPEGGWGFGQPPGEAQSVLPSAWAVLTLLQCDRSLPAVRDAVIRGAEWLLAAQAEDGSFPLAPHPKTVWYAGRVYSTAVAVLALTTVAREWAEMTRT